MNGQTEAQSDRSDQEKSDRSDLTKPWTIKGISWETRNAAIAASDREDMTIGAWLERAIRQTIQSDRKADRAPAPIESVRPTPQPVDLTALERMMAIAEKVTTMSGKPLPSDIRGKANKLLRVGLKGLASQTEPHA